MNRRYLAGPFALWIALGSAVLASTPDSPAPAAAGANAEELFQQAKAFSKGDGVPKDLPKAFELMRIAAGMEHAEAMGALGYFHSTGLGGAALDPQLAAGWFRKAAGKGSPKAMLNLASLLIGGKVPSSTPDDARREGVEWVKQAAATGLPEAALAYGSMLYLGENGLSADQAAAIPYLKTAAEANLPEAQNMLGNAWQNGTGTPMDDKEAVRWFRRAALAGNVKAQGNLGRILGPESPDWGARVEAVAWLMVAHDQGDVTAGRTLVEVSPGLKEDDFAAARARADELRKQIVPNK